MIIEFYDISTEGKPMIKEVHGVSRIPGIGDLFELMAARMLLVTGK